MNNLISQSELSRRIGTSQAYISKLVSQNKLISYDGGLDYEECLKKLRERKNKNVSIKTVKCISITHYAKNKTEIKFSVKSRDGNVDLTMNGDGFIFGHLFKPGKEYDLNFKEKLI